MKENNSNSVSLLWLLTIVFLLLPLPFCLYMPINELSAYGTVFATSAAFIAIVWFYNSLKLQSKQLDEQREQFLLQFQYMKKESKRNDLLMAKEILEKMEKDLNEKLKDIGTIDNLPSLFLRAMIHLGPITKSKDPEIIIKEFENYNKILTPSKLFMDQLKQAAIIILENEEISIIKDENEPEWFYDTYQKYLIGKPFFSKYQGSASMLSGFMIKTKII